MYTKRTIENDATGRMVVSCRPLSSVLLLNYPGPLTGSDMYVYMKA
jgi:hypothetical protein